MTTTATTTAPHVFERLTCTADEAVNLDLSQRGTEHPIRKGWRATGYQLVKINWLDNAATVEILYTREK